MFAPLCYKDETSQAVKFIMHKDYKDTIQWFSPLYLAIVLNMKWAFQENVEIDTKEWENGNFIFVQQGSNKELRASSSVSHC